MIILGSNGLIQVKYRSNGESDVFLLDISKDSEYVWTTSHQFPYHQDQKMI
jgi:hypothetical protein